MIYALNDELISYYGGPVCPQLHSGKAHLSVGNR